jgi:hypothetical protein
MHRIWLMPLAMLLCVAMACADDKGKNGSAKGDKPKAPAVSKEVPEIQGPDLDDKDFKLSDYRGKVVMLDFWGHW